MFRGAFILTRPLGAAVGDFLDKPVDHGGLALSRPLASVVLATAIALLVAILPQREAEADRGQAPNGRSTCKVGPGA